ncbi:MAG: hypothetical protein WBX25_21905 [Rhodomicrobium sp.]
MSDPSLRPRRVPPVDRPPSSNAHRVYFVPLHRKAWHGGGMRDWNPTGMKTPFAQVTPAFEGLTGVERNRTGICF